MAKLHSLVASNSFDLLVVHQRRTSIARLLRRQRAFDHGRDLAVDLDRGRKAGGDEEIGAPFCFTSVSSSWMNLMAWSRSIVRISSAAATAAGR